MFLAWRVKSRTLKLARKRVFCGSCATSPPTSSQHRTSTHQTPSDRIGRPCSTSLGTEEYSYLTYLVHCQEEADSTHQTGWSKHATSHGTRERAAVASRFVPSGDSRACRQSNTRRVPRSSSTRVCSAVQLRPEQQIPRQRRRALCFVSVRSLGLRRLWNGAPC